MLLFCLCDFSTIIASLFVYTRSFSIAVTHEGPFHLQSTSPVSWNWGYIVVVVHQIAMLLLIEDDTVFSAFVMITIFQRLLYSHFLWNAFAFLYFNCNATATLRRMSIANSSVLIGSCDIIFSSVGGVFVQVVLYLLLTALDTTTHPSSALKQPTILCHPHWRSRLGEYNVDC